MTPRRQQPWSCLTRHFFDGLFDMGFLSEAGTDSFKRMILGCCAVFLTFGLLLLRLFAIKYAGLSGLASAEPYRRAVLADHTFLIAVPMWIVALVTVLVGHSLFPDETDFRVLMALPVSRRLIFGTKLLALTLFAGLFTLAAHVALLPLLLMTSAGRWAAYAVPQQVAAFGVASLLASAFAVLSVTAVHGILVLTAPRGRVLTASAALRSAMMFGLIVSLPLVLRLPGQAASVASGSSWLWLAPPAWFLGLERWLLGDDSPAHLAALARIALVAVTLTAAVAAASYVVLYRRFDRVVLGPAHASEPYVGSTFKWTLGYIGSAFRRTGAVEYVGSALRRSWGYVGSAFRRTVSGLVLFPAGSRPVFTGIRTFTAITLRRSVLHQGILVALSAIGAGLVVNSLVAADLAGWLADGGHVSSRLRASVIWAPFALMFVASLAVRMALAVPIEPRANWIFRLTEQDAVRADQLDAAVNSVRRYGIIVPLVLTAPLEWVVLGRGAVGVVAVALLCGWLLVELLMKDWARIPFSCSYIPAKGFVPQLLLKGFASIVVFTTAGALLARFSVAGHQVVLTIDAVLVVMLLVLSRYRRHAWKHIPLEFEDQLPTDVNPLRLSQ